MRCYASVDSQWLRNRLVLSGRSGATDTATSPNAEATLLLAPECSPLTPALLEQWTQMETVEAGVSRASARSFRLSTKAQLRLIGRTG
jgi:hypothetical protein